MMDGLVKDFWNSLSKNVLPKSIDFLEGEIDSIIQNETVKNVPILKSIAGVIRVGKDLHERNLLQQTTIFLSELNSGNIDEEKLKKYKEKIQSDKEKEAELGRILLILNRNIDLEKSRYLAKLFVAYINELVQWDEFCEFTDITDRLFMEDFRLLKALHVNGEYEPKSGDNFRAERIYSVGITGIKMAKMIKITRSPQELDGRELNELGKKYCDIIFTKGGQE